MRDRTVAGLVSLRLDPTRCDASGRCARVAAALIQTDPWGYPLFPRRALDDAEVALARLAVDACPRRALHLDGPELQS